MKTEVKDGVIVHSAKVGNKEAIIAHSIEVQEDMLRWTKIKTILIALLIAIFIIVSAFFL